MYSKQKNIGGYCYPPIPIIQLLRINPNSLDYHLATPAALTATILTR